MSDIITTPPEEKTTAELCKLIHDQQERILALEQAAEDKQLTLTLLENADHEIDELKKQNAELRRENERLAAENSGMRVKAAPAKAGPVLYQGQESDLFPGEIKDIILSTLATAVEKAISQEDRTRRGDVLRDIIEANHYEGILQKKAEGLKTELTGYKVLDPATQKYLESIGFVFVSSSQRHKHYKMAYFGDRRYVTTIPCSGSDFRGGTNTAQEIITQMF